MGGIFFTTAASPFDWETVEVRRLQQAVKEHLDADSFFDMETVQLVLSELGPIPENVQPEQLQPPRRIPEFPFKVEAVKRKSPQEEAIEARHYFESQGFILVREEAGALIFRGKKGGITRITFEPEARIEHFPEFGLDFMSRLS
jgi:hypothetical protein